MDTKPENEKFDAETTTIDIIVKSLATLKDQELSAYELLTSMAREGFFEKPQQKKVVNSLADAVLEALMKQGGEDAR